MEERIWKGLIFVFDTKFICIPTHHVKHRIRGRRVAVQWKKLIIILYVKHSRDLLHIYYLTMTNS